MFALLIAPPLLFIQRTDRCILYLERPSQTVALYGIYGSHTIEACPLNNVESRRIVVHAAQVMESLSKKYKINKIVGQYHSPLEHTFLWVVDAEDPHLVQQSFIEAGAAKFNAVRIVPLITFSDVVDLSKKLGT